MSEWVKASAIFIGISVSLGALYLLATYAPEVIMWGFIVLLVVMVIATIRYEWIDPD